MKANPTSPTPGSLAASGRSNEQVGVIHLGYSIPVILEELARVRNYYSQFPFVRRCAIQFGAPRFDNDLVSFVTNLPQFVKDRVLYVPDPLGFEWVTAPDVLLAEILQKGQATGDCDCHVLLLNTLLASVGFETGFVAVKLDPAGDQFDHVISQVKLEKNWIDLDPCAKAAPQPFYLERLILR
jgi:hypothetical protein